MATSPIPPMLIQLQLETEKINGQLKQVTSGIDNLGKTVEKQGGILNNFKSVFAGVFGGNLATQGLMQVQNLVRGAIKDTEDYEHALGQLEAGMKSTNNVAGLNVEAMKQQASSLEKMAAVDENLILQSEAVFQTFTNVRNVVGQGNDIFNQATASALDLSVKMGGDLQGATVQLGKALNDPIKGIGALTRVGVVFTQQQKDQIKALVASGDVLSAQKVILKELNTEFGGAAKAQGDTFAGAVFRAKDAVQDFTRNLIMGLEPILLSIGKTIGYLVNTFIKPMTDFLMKNKEAVLAFATVLGVAVVALYAYKAAMVVTRVAQEIYTVVTLLMKGAQLASVASTNGLAASMLVLNAVMKANPIGVIVTAVALLAAGFVLAWNHSETFRKVIIAVGKAGIIAVGYLIEWFGKLVTAIIKVESGPLRLLLKGLALLKVPGAKEALNGIETAIDSVGTFFDNAAKSVKGYADNLDSLANKKITIPGTGKTPAKGGGGTTDKPIGVDPATVKATQAAEKQRLKDIESTMKKAIEIHQKMNDVIAEGAKKEAEETTKYQEQVATIKKKYADAEVTARKKNTDEIIKISKEYTKKETELATALAETKVKLQADANDKINQAEQDAAQKRLDIVKQSVDRLRSAFASATSTSITDIYKDNNTTSGLLTALKKRFTDAKKLQENAGALAAKGYSQVFIEQVVASGTEVGNALSKTLIDANPETTAEMQKLFGDLNDISAHGLDTLANQMSTSTNLATEELRNAYAQVGIDLQNSLNKINGDLAVSMSEAQKQYQQNLAEAAQARDEAILEANKALDEALAGIAQDLADALASAQKDYQDAIAQIQKDTKEKLTALQADLNALIATLNQLKATQAQIAQASIVPVYQTTPYNPLTGMTPPPVVNTPAQTTPYNPLAGFNVSNTFISSGIQSPSQVQDAVMNGVKFGTVVAGLPSTVSASKIAQLQRFA